MIHKKKKQNKLLIKNLMDNIDTISDRVGKKFKRFITIIKENKKIIYLSKKLATLEYIDDLNRD